MVPRIGRRGARRNAGRSVSGFMAKEKRDKRFSFTSEGMLSGTSIIVDRMTGVNYLFVYEGYAGGLCPLLDAGGKPIVTKAINSVGGEKDE